MRDCSTKVADGLVEMLLGLVKETVGVSQPTGIGEMEAKVIRSVRQLSEAWLGIWLTALGTAPMSPEIPCPCGEQAIYNRMRESVLVSGCGRISFKRRYYLCPHCHEGQYPLDDVLGYEPGQMTPQLTSVAGWVGAELPFRRGSKLLEELCGFTLSENSVREATQQMGQEVSKQEAVWKAESEDVAVLKARDHLPKRRNRFGSTAPWMVYLCRWGRSGRSSRSGVGIEKAPGEAIRHLLP